MSDWKPHHNCMQHELKLYGSSVSLSFRVSPPIWGRGPSKPSSQQGSISLESREPTDNSIVINIIIVVVIIMVIIIVNIISIIILLLIIIIILIINSIIIII